MLYKSFILCNFNYCPAVWHQCGITNTRRLEKVQYRALKFVYRDFDATYEELLAKANLPTLHVARVQNIAMEVLKAVNGMSPGYIQDMFHRTTHSYNLRNKSFSSLKGPLPEEQTHSNFMAHKSGIDCLMTLELVLITVFLNALSNLGTVLSVVVLTAKTQNESFKHSFNI